MKYLQKLLLFVVCFTIGLFGAKYYFWQTALNARSPEQKVVQVGIYYGLGNNMFQYAAALAYALEHNKKLYVHGDVSKLENAFDITLNKPENEDIPVFKNLEAQKKPFIGNIFVDYDSIVPLKSDRYVYLRGLFQNERYFSKYRKEILRAFRFKENMSDKNKQLVKSIQNSNSVAVHIRRGDYTAPNAEQHVLSPHYYKVAADYIAKRVKNPHFYIFSDDMKWVKKNIKLEYPHTFIEHNKGDFSYNDMRLMSLCKHNIIANSSFSWWGAWLNKNPDKIVITPDVWLKEDKNFINNIVPQNWIRLPGKANIAMLYIATGRYIVFFDEYYKSMEKNFLPEDNKTYFVWTDSDRQFPQNVIKIPTENLGWPKATLYRYKLFQNAWDKLKDFDYMYYLNANMLAVRPIRHEIIPSEEQGITATLHPGYYKSVGNLPYDRNPKSTAYIPHTSPQHEAQEKYFMGGFNGGTTKGFKHLIDTIADNTNIDEQNGVIAKWHDESHLNRYLYDKNPLILPPMYGYPETRVGSHATHNEFHKTHKLLIMDKSNPRWGGHQYLRGQTDTKIGTNKRKIPANSNSEKK